nr:hypothetical protein TetV2_00528 [Oceanusvirus sp.]
MLEYDVRHKKWHECSPTIAVIGGNESSVRLLLDDILGAMRPPEIHTFSDHIGASSFDDLARSQIAKPTETNDRRAAAILRNPPSEDRAVQSVFGNGRMVYVPVIGVWDSPNAVSEYVHANTDVTFVKRVDDRDYMRRVHDMARCDPYSAFDCAWTTLGDHEWLVIDSWERDTLFRYSPLAKPASTIQRAWRAWRFRRDVSLAMGDPTTELGRRCLVASWQRLPRTIYTLRQL